MSEINTDRLRSLVERIEHLESEKKEIQEDIKEIYMESKAAGFDNKAIRAIIKLRAMNKNDRDSQEYILDCYRKALGL